MQHVHKIFCSLNVFFLDKLAEKRQGPADNLCHMFPIILSYCIPSVSPFFPFLPRITSWEQITIKRPSWLFWA